MLFFCLHPISLAWNSSHVNLNIHFTSLQWIAYLAFIQLVCIALLRLASNVIHDTIMTIKTTILQHQKNPNYVSCCTLLEEFFARINTFTETQQLHAKIVLSGNQQDGLFGANLMNAYFNCRRFEDARQVFNKIPKPNKIHWNTLIKGYAINGYCEEALELYHQMLVAALYPNVFTFPFVVKACADLAALQQGRCIHKRTIRSGLDSNIYVGSALIDMYAKCRKMEDACKVFNKMSERNIISWTAMIAGFAQNGNAKKALEVFHQVQVEGMKPNSVTITSLLPACTILSAVHLGKEIHGCLVKGVFDFDVVAANALVDMYGKCSVIDYARKVFDNMSTRTANSWNAMIVGYTRNRNCDEALRLFHQMQEASVGPDSVTWNAMISGYAQNGYANEAFHFTRTMQLADVKPISITILSILPLCAKLGALQKGREIHGFVVRRELESETSVGNALLDMYAKCGNIEIANKVFHKITQRDTISWTIIIAAHGMHGRGRDSLILFQKMLQEDIKPNRITFIGVLSACSHAGLVDEGWHCFHCMIQEFSLTPWVEHYACMVDLLGRAHKLDEACELIKMMPIEPGAGVWGALLSACRVYHNIELGEYAAEQLFKLEPLNSGNYILLSNIYAESGRLDEARNIRVMMKDKGVKKTPGCSWIEIKEGIHQFFVGDVSHPETEKIYAMLEKLYQLLRAAGYVPDTRFALHDV